MPRTLIATVAPESDASFAITSTTREDHTGELAATAHSDIDDGHATALEDMSVVSRRRRDGARVAPTRAFLAAIYRPTASPGVTAVECWGSDFTRVFHSDSGIKPSEGNPAECVYAALAP